MNKITKTLLFELAKDLLVFLFVSSLLVLVTDSVFLPVIIGMLAYLGSVSTTASLAKTMIEEFEKESQSLQGKTNND